MKSQNNWFKLIFYWKHVAYSSKQLFISAPLICCTKSIGKFPKNVSHASFLQCSAKDFMES